MGWQWMVASGLVAAAVILSPGAAGAAAEQGYEPATALVPSARPSAVPKSEVGAATVGGRHRAAAALNAQERAAQRATLSLSVTGTDGRVVAGKPTAYEITLRNEGTGSQAVTLRASVPLRMVEVTPLDGGKLSRDGVIDWPVTLARGASTTVRLTGVFDQPVADDSGRVPRVAFTACALDPAERQPIVCATDVATLVERDGPRWWLLVGAALAAGAAVAGGVTTALERVRRRRRARAWAAEAEPGVAEQEPGRPDPESGRSDPESARR